MVAKKLSKKSVILDPTQRFSFSHLDPCFETHYLLRMEKYSTKKILIFLPCQPPSFGHLFVGFQIHKPHASPKKMNIQ